MATDKRCVLSWLQMCTELAYKRVHVLPVSSAYTPRFWPGLISTAPAFAADTSRSTRGGAISTTSVHQVLSPSPALQNYLIDVAEA